MGLNKGIAKEGLEVKSIENDVAQHYGDADLLSRILSALEADGYDLERLQSEDLAPVEEFHIGGRESTKYAVAKMSLTAAQRVLDIGCGIGGAARYMASAFGCNVNGIDLTPEFISCGQDLTKRLRLQELVKLDVASALDLPFRDGVFDAAITLHVAMNIEDRKSLYHETARVLKPGATLCIFDVMRKSDAKLTYPVPWATTAETSFLKTPEQMNTLLEDAGFVVREVEDRSSMALAFFKKRLASTPTAIDNKPSALGVHLVMKERAKEKFENTLSNIQNGYIAPVQMIAVKQ